MERLIKERHSTTLGAVLLLWSIASATWSPGANAGQKITVGAETSLMASSVWIADALGYFKEEGIDVTVERFGAGRNALETLIGVSDLGRSKVDLATVATTPIVFNSFKNEPYRILMQIAYADDPTRVVAKTSSGITRPADFKGKTIGLQQRTSAHYYFTSLFLAEHGLTLGDIKLVDINAKDFVAALNRNELDGVVTWEPHVTTVRTALGADNVVEFGGKAAYQKDFFLVADTAFLNNNIDGIAKLAKALARAEAYINTNRPQSQEVLSRVLKMDLATVKESWSKYHVRSFIDNAAINELQLEGSWAVQNKLVPADKAPDYRAWFDTRVMQRVAPQNVAIRDD